MSLSPVVHDTFDVQITTTKPIPKKIRIGSWLTIKIGGEVYEYSRKDAIPMHFAEIRFTPERLTVDELESMSAALAQAAEAARDYDVAHVERRLIS